VPSLTNVNVSFIVTLSLPSVKVKVSVPPLVTVKLPVPGPERISDSVAAPKVRL
jgi:hypothetical protein